MSNYFSDCQDVKELRKKYRTLIRMNHPDSTLDEEKKKVLHDKCIEINKEYESLLKTLPDNELEEAASANSLYSHIASGNKEAHQAITEIRNNIGNLQIDYTYYLDYQGVLWWEDIIADEKASSIRLFWEICYDKKIIGEEFARLYSLCDNNVELMHRVVMFLGTAAISEHDIHTNLTSPESIPFFNDAIPCEGMPNYNYFFLISKENLKPESLSAWIEYCQHQRDNFNERFADVFISKIQENSRQK